MSNRPKAPQAFTQDLEKAFGLISSLPLAGQQVRHSTMDGLRRVLMGRVRYYLYYRFDTETERVEVLALWHASRSGQPRLG